MAARTSTIAVRSLIQLSRELSDGVDAMRFGPPVSHVYNPLAYAKAPHERYLTKFGGLGAQVLLVGMNPGPFGMAQTGVPFGEVSLVKNWLGVTGQVLRPADEHPKRKIVGFDCARSEVSGQRLWGWAQDRFGSPEAFFRRFFVTNYCPLVFMQDSSKNLTPDKLPARERSPLFERCDESLRGVVATLEVKQVIGIGKFAEKRALAALDGQPVRVGSILHPSPASPKANRGWAKQAEAELGELGVRLSIAALGE